MNNNHSFKYRLGMRLLSLAMKMVYEKDFSSHTLSGSEALFGFMGWLTSRNKEVTFSGHHEASEAAILVQVFCDENKLPEPRNDWHIHLVHPKED